jgi:L-lactate dehydrogenase complex protein LldF
MSLTSADRGFRDAARAGLQDASMRAAIAEATDRLRDGRLAVWDTLLDVEGLRERAREARHRSVEGLRAHLEEFATAAEAAGAHVSFCGDAAEASRRITALCAEAGATLVAKSKSMLTEEIGLNEALAGAGIRCVETDLGEYLNQLAGDPPAHILCPSLGKSAEDSAALLARAGGEPLSTDLPALTRAARLQLREVFTKADVGVTGVNFGVAETGSLCLVTNEGNGRLVSSLPRLHIAVMGMERLVLTLDDLAVLLSLLAASGTGQRLSSYTTLITGPRRPGEADGPDDLHIVIVDNGRSRLLGTPYQEMLHCIRCGSCLNVCPVYRNAGAAAYGSVYSGPMAAVLVPLLEGLDTAGDMAHASSLCGSCVEACPVKIPIPELLLELRSDLVERRIAPMTERLAFGLWSLAWSSAATYRLTGRLARLLQPLITPVARRLPVMSQRRIPVLPPSFRDTWKGKRATRGRWKSRRAARDTWKS